MNHKINILPEEKASVIGRVFELMVVVKQDIIDVFLLGEKLWDRSPRKCWLDVGYSFLGPEVPLPRDVEVEGDAECDETDGYFNQHCRLFRSWS